MAANKKILSISVAVLTALQVGLFGFVAEAGQAGYSSDTNVALTSQTLTIVAGSSADSVATGSTTVIVSITSPDTLTIRSANKFELNNNASIAYTCGSSFSELVVSGTRTVVITPSMTVCGSSSGGGSSGGGGGGGGGGGSSPPSSTPIDPVSPASSTSPASCIVKGDISGDCKVTLTDFSIAAFWYRKPITNALVQEREKTILNNDGKINLVDFSIMAFYYTK